MKTLTGIFIIIILCRLYMATANTTLRITCWNSRGMSAAVPYIRDLMSRSDVICISEHWLHHNRLNTLEDLSTDFYTIGRASQRSMEDNYGIRRGVGGVAILWRKTIEGVSPMLEIKHDRICGVRVQLDNGNSVNIYSVYLPAAGSIDSMEIVLDEISGIIEANGDDTQNIVCGDFNGDVGSLGGPRGNRCPTRAGQRVSNFARQYNLHIANLMEDARGPVDTFWGHNGKSAIDYIMVCEALKRNITTCLTENEHPLNTSDHLPVLVEIRIKLMSGKVESNAPQRMLRWDKLGEEGIREIYEIPLAVRLDNIGINTQNLDCEYIDQLFNKVVKAITEIGGNIPTSKFRKHLKPYWCKELGDLKKEKVLRHRIWKTAGKPSDPNDRFRIDMKNSKKLFTKTLRALCKAYENERIAEVATAAELDRDKFWRLFKAQCGTKGSKVNAINNEQGAAVYDIDSILEIWKNHFSGLCTPKHKTEYDGDHYAHVSNKVNEWAGGEEISPLLDEAFSYNEVKKAISKLHCKKAPGHDGISAEHIRYGGGRLCHTLCQLYNMCVRAECIPSNFRQGIQIPLYKGKNTNPLDPDNYRGITLLSSFNKLFEMLLWQRMEKWWYEENIVSELQGACRKGSSCVHTALALQETISAQRERGKKVFVAYFDVSKAFDSVWIDGLFFQLHNLGVKDSLWRLLYKSYRNFMCRVRIGDKVSAPYQMLCGIHQGGFLSLIKYISFINSLLVQLKQSGLCCTIARVQTTPQGYADDLATCTTNGNNMTRVLEMVGGHGRKWRYAFNARKSSVMVYGETMAEMKVGRENRMFKLGDDRVKESSYYEHVGIKACLKGDTHCRTEEKAKKARKVLNMASCLGIKRGGLTMATCCLIYWSVVIPTICFGSEIWILKQKDIDILNGFQRYAAKRIQRLHPRSLNATCYACLGWIHIIRLIKVKKLMFCRSIIVLKENMPIREVFIDKIRTVREENLPLRNDFDSPITDLINTGHEMNVMNHLIDFANGNVISKSKWRNIVWTQAWQQEIDEWHEKVAQSNACSLVSMVTTGPSYSIWWQIADKTPELVNKCEVMIRLLCKASSLKCDNMVLRGGTIGDRMCTQCELGCPEDIKHVVMQCPTHQQLRESMNNQIEALTDQIEQEEYFPVVMGKFIPEWEIEDMIPIWIIACRHITRMYYNTINARIGIG